jgi:PBP1b-binding outer membrane lipoprotein LpoB
MKNPRYLILALALVLAGCVAPDATTNSVPFAEPLKVSGEEGTCRTQTERDKPESATFMVFNPRTGEVKFINAKKRQLFRTKITRQTVVAVSKKN